MWSMNTQKEVRKRTQGQRLQNAERMVIISKLVDHLCEGYQSTNALAKLLEVDRSTIEAYRPLADELIGKMKLDRNVIRNLQVRRTYKIIEMLMADLIECDGIKEKTLVYNQIAKFSQHLALICGLNTEVQVTADASQLVIIRSSAKSGDKKQSSTIDVNTI